MAEGPRLSLAARQPAAAASQAASARAGGPRVWPSRARHTHTKAPYEFHVRRRTLGPRGRPGRARAGCDERAVARRAVVAGEGAEGVGAAWPGASLSVSVNIRMNALTNSYVSVYI